MKSLSWHMHDVCSQAFYEKEAILSDFSMKQILFYVHEIQFFFCCSSNVLCTESLCIVRDSRARLLHMHYTLFSSVQFSSIHLTMSAVCASILLLLFLCMMCSIHSMVKHEIASNQCFRFLLLLFSSFLLYYVLGIECAYVFGSRTLFFSVIER